MTRPPRNEPCAAIAARCATRGLLFIALKEERRRVQPGSYIWKKIAFYDNITIYIYTRLNGVPRGKCIQDIQLYQVYLLKRF
jgi:hypothetical protein